MNIFKRRSYAWWQVGLLKISLLAVGIAIGSYWPGIFAPYATELALLGIVLGVYLAYAWFRQ